MQKDISILLVEDTPLALTVVISIFSSLGIECHTAKTGKQALDALKKHSYDLILLDLGLPDIHGIEILEIIKEEKLQPMAHISVLTGHSESEFKDKSISLGAKDFIQKPFTLDIAKSLLKKLGK